MLQKVGAALVKHIQPLVSTGSSDSVEKREFTRFQPRTKKPAQEPESEQKQGQEQQEQKKPRLKVIPPQDEEAEEGPLTEEGARCVSLSFLELMSKIRESSDLLSRLFGARAYRSKSSERSEIQRLPKGTILDQEK